MSQATLFQEHTVQLGMSGNWMITGFTPFVNGEAYAYVTSSHFEGNFIKIFVSNISNHEVTVVVGAVIEYIQW